MRAILVVVVLALATDADAGKPKAAAAKAALDGFAKALIKGEAGKQATFEPVAKLTSLPFRILVDDGDGVKCDTTVSDRAKLVAALECARESSATAPFKPYSAKVLKNLWGKVRDAKPEIEALAKTHVLYVHEATGEDVSELAIVAVTSDADATARVSHVFSSYLTK
jgi:hypothetical protein